MGELHLDNILFDSMPVASLRWKASIVKALRFLSEKNCAKRWWLITICAQNHGGRGQYGHVVMKIVPTDKDGLRVLSQRLLVGCYYLKIHPCNREGCSEQMKNGVIAGYPCWVIRLCCSMVPF